MQEKPDPTEDVFEYEGGRGAAATSGRAGGVRRLVAGWRGPRAAGGADGQV